MLTRSLAGRVLPGALLAGALLLPAGCRKSTTATETPAAAPAPTDQQIANDVQGRINAEQALNGQNIQVNVNNATVTLEGSVNNDAARALAAADSGAATGVKTVINNLTVAPPVVAKQAEAPRPERKQRRPKPVEEAKAAPAPAPPPPAQPTPAPRPATPPPPPKPVVRTVSVPAGTSLPVRITEGLSSQTAQQGETIHGVLAADIITSNMIAIPRGARVTGTVVDAKDATHFSGSSRLAIALTSVDVNGQTVPVSTTPYAQEGKGRGKNTALKTGGGAALGAIIGALAGGGKGAAIGAASGGGLGAGVNAVTRGEQVKIPAETLINFKLQAPVSVQTSRSAGGSNVPTYNDDSQ